MKIEFLEFGEKGQQLVFLHGWQQDKKSFLPLVGLLHDKFRLYLLDLPGFGQSESPSEVFGSFEYAQEIASWIKSKKMESIVLVGHSFGGKIAAIIASQEPKLVSKLILLGSSGFPSSSKAQVLKKYVPKTLQKALSPYFIKFWASRDYKQAGSLLPIFKKVVAEDLTSVFESILQPTLILWGDRDQETSLESGRKIHRLIPHSHLVIFPGDHFVFWQRSKEISEKIIDFVKN